MLPDRVVEAVRRLARPVCGYVYDTAVARFRVSALRAALPPGTSILYAMKANGHPDVVAAFAGCADGLEVASGGELALARAAGARRVAFGGPAKTDSELRAAVRAARDGIEVTVNCESEYEVRRLALVAGSDAPRLRVALRVNRSDAATLAGSHAMTGVPTPFGMAPEALPDAVAAAGPLPIVGFGLHAVSNNLDAAAHAAFIADCLDWSVTAAARLGIDLRQVNVGGGFGIDYTGDATFDLDVLRRLTPMPPAGVDLVVEPGRFVSAPIGWYAAEVIDVKHTHGRWFAVLRGGTHHFRLPAAWGYSHPFTVVPVDAWDYPFARPTATATEVDAVGELCTPRDVLTRGQRVQRIRAGDILVFAQTGGYAWDISHHDFLKHPYPEVVILS